VKVLITGSSGYVGYVLSRFFTDRGVPVVGLDLAPNRAWEGHERFRFRACDVTRRAALAEAFREERPTHVIHLAFLMNPIHDARREHEIDVGGSINVLEEAQRTVSVRQLVLMSSTSAYGAWPTHRPWIPETAPLRPRDYRYGQHKQEVEERFASAAVRSTLKLVILRMCTAVGATYHKAGGVVALLANAPFLPRIEGRHCELQLIHEDDLTALLELVVHDPGIEGVFNLAPDSFATTRELVPEQRFVPVPLWLARGVVALLWRLHLSAVMPSAMDLSTWGIVADPAKLMARYGYRFEHGTLEAFRVTVRERRAKGTL
jgi:nucleoside-diphosphate-sugar epimerase